jgi:hypothetical protein
LLRRGPDGRNRPRNRDHKRINASTTPTCQIQPHKGSAAGAHPVSGAPDAGGLAVLMPSVRRPCCRGTGWATDSICPASARVHLSGGFALIESDDAKALTEFALAWHDIMVRPQTIIPVQPRT